MKKLLLTSILSLALALPALARKTDTKLPEKTTAQWLVAHPEDKNLAVLAMIGLLGIKGIWVGGEDIESKKRAAKKISACVDYIASGLKKEKAKPAVVAKVIFACSANEGFVKN